MTDSFRGHRAFSRQPVARQSSVLFALVIAAVALKERPGRLRVLGGIANVVGVVLIAFSR